MREPEAVETPPPGKYSERPRSKHREPDIRNVEAVGSNPITSTKESPVQWTDGGSPVNDHEAPKGVGVTSSVH